MRVLMKVGLIGNNGSNKCNGRITLIHSKKADIRLLPVTGFTQERCGFNNACATYTV